MLEDHLNQLELGYHQPTPQMAYYVPESAYYNYNQPTDGIPPINPPPPPWPTPMDRTHNFSEVGTTPKKAGTQRIPTGRPPTCTIHSLPKYGIPTPRPHIPITATHGQPWRPRSTPKKKTQMIRKHAGKPHQKNQTLQQSALLLNIWIWCQSPRHRMTSWRSHLSHAQHITWQITYGCQLGSNYASATQINDIWDRRRYGTDLSKQHQKSAICDVVPTIFRKKTRTEATVPTPEKRVSRPWGEQSSAATIVLRQHDSPPPGMYMKNRGRKCRTIKYKEIVTHNQSPPPKNNKCYSNLYKDNEDEDEKTIVHRNCTKDFKACTDPLSDNSSIKRI